MTNDVPAAGSRAGTAALALDRHELELLELIIGGLLGPIDGYCLPGAAPAGWPFEAQLVVGGSFADRMRVGESVELTDPDGTPLAELLVTAVRSRGDGRAHVAGGLRGLRPPEHGPARDLRLSASDDLSGSRIALFDDVPDPASLLHLARDSGGRPIVLLGIGGSASGATRMTALVDLLRRCAGEIEGATVRYLPAPASGTSTDDRGIVDAVLSTLRADDVLDFTRPGSERASEAAAADGLVVLFSGLSGSGKSTLARALAERLPSVGRRGVLLDGDAVRRVVSAGLGFSAADREENLYRIGWVAARVAEGGGVAVCAPIAPFASSRERIRSMAEEVGRFVLVYVSTPIEVCEQRDRKGLYARARAGELTDFTGVDSPYEEPVDADIVIDTSVTAIDDGVRAIIESIAG